MTNSSRPFAAGILIALSTAAAVALAAWLLVRLTQWILQIFAEVVRSFFPS